MNKLKIMSDHLSKVAELPCMISGKTPVQLHHCKGGSMSEAGFTSAKGKKPSDWLVIPLHVDYHTGDYGIHTMGVKSWECQFDSQHELLLELSQMLQTNLLGNARDEKD